MANEPEWKRIVVIYPEKKLAHFFEVDPELKDSQIEYELNKVQRCYIDPKMWIKHLCDTGKFKYIDAPMDAFGAGQNGMMWKMKK